MTAKEKIAISVGAAIAALYLFRTHLSGQPVATVTTSEGFDLSPYGGPTTYPQGVKDMADAIARAEGFYVDGTIPNRAHNPGDLKVPGWAGENINGISVFADDASGFTALYKQLYLILTGGSSYYNLDMTIRQMASQWTTTESDSWASNVADALGVDASTHLWEVLA